MNDGRREDAIALLRCRGRDLENFNFVWNEENEDKCADGREG